jgi:predicted PurR-regulated permease PerM
MMADSSGVERRKRPVPGSQQVVPFILVTLAGALYFGRDILVPVALAILLSFVLVPAVRALRRVRVPRVAAVLLVVVLAFGLLGV